MPYLTHTADCAGYTDWHVDAGGGGGGGGGTSAEEGYGLVPSEDGEGPLVWGRAEASAVSRKVEALELENAELRRRLGKTALTPAYA